ncbi:MAG: hypothetical protein ACRED1_00295 [Limisphaerales bacterium]
MNEAIVINCDFAGVLGLVQQTRRVIGRQRFPKLADHPLLNAAVAGVFVCGHQFFWVHDMRIFEVFARTIAALPAESVVMALELECQMLREDVESKRLPLPRDACSIFYFRDFVHAASLGQAVNPARPLPVNHLEFFRETIARLARAQVLPPAAVNQFDDAFVGDL